MQPRRALKNLWRGTNQELEEPSRVTEVFLAKEEYSKRKTKRKKIRQPIYDPRPSNQQHPNVEEINQLLKDLDDAHEDALATDRNKLVSRYGSSSWRKLLQPSPPVSSVSEPESSVQASSNSEHENDSDGFNGDIAQFPPAAVSAGSIHHTSGPLITSEEFYEKVVVVTEDAAAAIEQRTRGQSSTAE